MEHTDKQIPIWFFIGSIVLIYGVLITVMGLYGWLFPPAAAERVALWELHADFWWGLVLLGIGLFYVIKFKPAAES